MAPEVIMAVPTPRNLAITILRLTDHPSIAALRYHVRQPGGPPRGGSKLRGRRQIRAKLLVDLWVFFLAPSNRIS